MLHAVVLYSIHDGRVGAFIHCRRGFLAFVVVVRSVVHSVEAVVVKVESLAAHVNHNIPNDFVNPLFPVIILGHISAVYLQYHHQSKPLEKVKHANPFALLACRWVLEFSTDQSEYAGDSSRRLG